MVAESPVVNCRHIEAISNISHGPDGWEILVYANDHPGGTTWQQILIEGFDEPLKLIWARRKSHEDALREIAP